MNLSRFVRRDLDIGLIAAIGLSLGAGVTVLYSASYDWDSGLPSDIYEKQMTWVLVGWMALVITMGIPIKIFYAFAYIFYGLAVVLLISVFEWGNQRWFNFGPIYLQPSELAKIATVLALARYLSYSNRDLTRVLAFVPPLLLVLVPILLVFKQPDLGTALVFGALVLPMFFWAGAKPLHLFFLISPGLTLICAFHPWTLAPMMVLLIASQFIARPRLFAGMALMLVNLIVGIGAPYMWEHKLHDYQKRRVLTFLDPDTDKLGAGYQVIQSKIAIGSGGLTGKGFLDGTQTKLAFLPEQHTDFIFAVICEEFGFVGAMFVLALFMFILWRALSISVQAKSRFSSLVAVGLASILLFHIFVNIGMTIGIMPVTGLPLPFLSYGGSTLTMNMVLCGLLLNIYASRYKEDY